MGALLIRLLNAQPAALWPELLKDTDTIQERERRLHMPYKVEELKLKRSPDYFHLLFLLYRAWPHS